MASNEVDFLRDQVDRLNALLGRYQEHHSLPAAEDDVTGNLPPKPWLVNKELLSPLLCEYDSIVDKLQKDGDDYQKQVLDFKEQLEQIMSENDRLRQDLKDVIDQQINGSGSAGQLSATSSPSVANLQHQLRLALQEKEVCQGKWRAATQELDRVEAEMQALKESHQWTSVAKKAQDVQEQYAQSVSVLNAEVETLQSDLRQVRQQLTESQRQITELKKTNYSLQQQLSVRDEERTETLWKGGIADSKMSEIQRVMEDLKQRLVQATREAEQSKKDRSLAETRLSELTRRFAETEHRESEAIQQVRDAISMAESSVLEKDQAELQMRHKEEEVAQLQNSMAKLINEAGIRTRQEVDKVKEQVNDRMGKLTEELHTLEMDNTEKQARLERLLREKRAVETELQKVQREGKVEDSRYKDSVEELNRRVTEAQRQRENLLLKLQTLTQTLEKEREESEQMKESYEIKLQTTQDRLTALQQEYDIASDERLRHLDSNNLLSKKLQQAEQDRDAVHRKFLRELALIEQDQQTKTRGFEVQLQTAEDARCSSVTELRKLLTAQQRMSARWKEECQTISLKYEGKLAELRAEVTQLRQRNDQLTSLLKESQTKTAEAEKLMSEYTRNIRLMETRIQKAESHASEITKQLSRQQLKERQLASERQSLMNELSRSQRDMNDASGLFQQSANKSALHVDDLQGSR